jgi:hypothetical protein
MTLDTYRTATSEELKEAAAKCFEDLDKGSWDRKAARLLEAQFYLKELEQRELQVDRDQAEVERLRQDKQYRTSHRLELVVIWLILLEVLLGIVGILITIREGKEQGALMASTAKILSSLQATTETMNRASQRQAGALSDVAVDISYYHNTLYITNTGHSEIVLLGYQFDGRRGEHKNSPVRLVPGEPYSVSEVEETIREKFMAYAGVTLPFRAWIKKQDGTEYSAEVMLAFSAEDNPLKIGYGPTTLTRYSWTGPQKGK